MKTCTNCNETKPYTDFYKNKNLKDGHQPRCKVCMKDAYNTSRNKKKDHYNNVAKSRRARLFNDFRAWKSNSGCVHCGEDNPHCLDLHHPDPNEKEFSVSNLIGRNSSWETVMIEVEKCIVLCRNCHAKTHAKVSGFERYLK